VIDFMRSDSLRQMILDAEEEPPPPAVLKITGSPSQPYLEGRK